MKQNLLAIFFLSIVLLQSCCKKEGGSIDLTHDMDSIKAYAYFLPGTYWIYEDNTGNIDSMYVVSASSGYDTAHAADFFISRWHSTYDTYDYIVEWNTTWTSSNPKKHIVFITKTKPGDYVGQTLLMFYPQQIGFYGYWYNNKTTLTGYESVFNNGIQSFQSTIQMNLSQDVTNNDQQTNYYIAKGFGIVEEDLIDSNVTWKLKRYNILQ